MDPSAMTAEVGGVTYDLQQSGAETSPHVSYSYVPLRGMNATQPGTEVCGFVLRAAWPYGGFANVVVEVDHCPALEPLS